MIPVTYTKWHLANNFGDTIELNESLKDHHELHDAILQHELGHRKENTFKKDFLHDLTPISDTGHISQKQLILFMLKHPRTLTQVLPIYWSFKRKQLICDFNMIIMYIILFGIIGLLLFLF